MPRFSQRKGYTEVRRVIQKESIDSALRTALWNVMTERLWRLSARSIIEDLTYELWKSYFKRPLDEMPGPNDLINVIRRYFFKCPWYEVYDLLEFIPSHLPDPLGQHFRHMCNFFLEQEQSAYRFVGGHITEITSDEEINEVEAALAVPIAPVNEHLERALELLSDKKAPDYRNSIKESISAVEAICQKVASKPKATLGDALKTLEGKVNLHGALKGAFDKLYGYASDAEGIRHATLDEPNLYYEDAKFMLVSCAAFINYLIQKAARAGIKL